MSTKPIYARAERCRVCGSAALEDVIRFEGQYIGTTFVTDNRGPMSEARVPLTVTLCDRHADPQACGLVQLRETVDPELLYRAYFYRSATNATMRADLREVVEHTLAHLGPTEPGDVVVDIGANDGTTISYFPEHLTRVGVEPAKNIDWSHLDPSITIVNDFFGRAALEPKLDRPVKAFTACAMFYDLDAPNRFVADVKALLAPDGVWCLQLSYLVAMLENLNFYDICHEHLEYYALGTLDALMRRHGLMVFDAVENAVNGGSVRAFVTHVERDLARSEGLEGLLAREAELALHAPATYRAFEARVRRLGEVVVGALREEAAAGGKVLGLGASTKGNVLLQLFGIDRDVLPKIAEINPTKIGLRTLGTDIELISDEDAEALAPTLKLVLPWYFKDEIVARERAFLDRGGKLLFPMPYPHVVTKDGERALDPVC